MVIAAIFMSLMLQTYVRRLELFLRTAVMGLSSAYKARSRSLCFSSSLHMLAHWLSKDSTDGKYDPACGGPKRYRGLAYGGTELEIPACIARLDRTWEMYPCFEVNLTCLIVSLDVLAEFILHPRACIFSPEMEMRNVYGCPVF